MNEQLSLLDLPLAPLPFAGATYDAKYDCARLTGQMERVFNAMKDGRFYALREVADIANAPESSVSAQIRNLKKKAFGGHGVEKRPRGDRQNGLWEYRLIVAGV